MTQERSWTTHPVVGGLIGIFAGGLTVLVIESAGHALLGTADPADPSTATTPMMLSVLVAWVVGSAVAGLVATAWTGARSIVPGAIGGLVLFAGAAATLMAIPHPVWMAAGAVILMPTAAWLAARSRMTRAV